MSRFPIVPQGFNPSNYATAAQGIKADTAIQVSLLNAPNGVAGLDASGKVASALLPTLGAYKGLWNAATNTPAIVNGVGNLGDFYVVGTAGNVVIDGSGSWKVGDQLHYNGTIWEAARTGIISGVVTSVAGQVGAVVLAISDITNLQTTLNGKASTAAATTGADGLLSAADKTKLNGIATGATANATDAQLRDRSTHTGSQAISTVTNLQTTLDGKASTSLATTGAPGLLSATDKTKLDSVASGATVNATDAQLRDRATHTGSQAATTVSVAAITGITGVNVQTVLAEIKLSVDGKAVMNDSVTGISSVWSSDKTAISIINAVNAATTTINSTIDALPDINDAVAATTSLWSSQKISDAIAAAGGGGGGGAAISDTTTSTTTTWSSTKITAMLAAIPAIDDATTGAAKLWSSSKINTMFSALPTIDDVSTATTKLWSSNKINAMFSALPVLNDLTTSASSLWSSSKISSMIPVINDSSTSTTTLWSSSKVNSSISAAIAGLPVINDASTATTVLWSGNKINTAINDAVTMLTTGAPANLNTFAEVATAIGNDPAYSTTINTALGNRLRFDLAQTLTTPQQTQGLANLGAIASSAIGDPETDFVAVFNAGLV